MTKAWTAFLEVQALAVIGSVAKPLWKEVPRFREFREQWIEIWHECRDLDLALWIDSQRRLGELRRVRDRASREAYEGGIGTSIANHEVDVFLFEPQNDRYLGRLCSFNQRPKGKPDCSVPGCGAIPFNKRIADFAPCGDLLASNAPESISRCMIIHSDGIIGRLPFPKCLTPAARCWRRIRFSARATATSARITSWVSSSGPR